MASTMAANATSVHNVRASRASNMASSGMSNDRMSKGFGGNKAWNSNIWGDSNLGNGFDDKHLAETAFEGKSGSGSLLSTSESDGWAARPNLPWTTVNTTSALARGSTTAMTTSPAQTRGNDLSASTIPEAGDGTSYFTLPRPSGIGNGGGPGNHRSYLNNSNDGISPTTDGMSFGGLAGFRNGESRHQVNTSGFGGSPVGTRFPMKPGSASMDASNSDEAMPLPQGFSEHLPRNPYAHMPHNSASFAPQRPAHSSHPSFHSENQGFDSRYAGGAVDVNAGLSKLQLNDGGFVHPGAQRPGYMSHGSYDASLSRGKYPQAANDESNYQPVPAYMTDGAADLGLAYQASRAGADGDAISPAELTRMGSPFYPGLDSASVAGPHYRNASGSRLSEAQTAALERKLRGIQPDADFASSVANPLQRVQYPPAYDFAGYQTARLNALAGFYPVSPLGGMGASTGLSPRSHRENDLSQIVRSPLLEEFRANSKGNKRYELKDIYNHVVEFSGDQHGSRFIQQKLETANSDEKEQVFREIQPNSLQLMTDVFGNYVVQKLFEHGNQTQKKILANQMKGHVLSLSTQMYGCRVVQKALEHILTDQQASMVKELESHVLKCVRDQNGNHVIQKAIERVPSHYVQFIINSFKGQVHRLAAHPYGCRVIQRMLEHCEEEDRESILGELHACTGTLIPDQFGNYVIQHVIENGEEKDRSRMVTIVVSQLMMYSKHKFASNVVEKSIEFGEESQRVHIISTLTSPNDKGESPLLGLMRDQYGNYVIQKILGQLKGAEKEALIDQIKPLLSQLKKFSYGKQIVAIEKLIFDPNMPTSALSHVISSTTPPNSHKSSPQPSKRSMENGEVPAVGAAPPTPPPTDTQATDNAEPKGLAQSTMMSASGSEATTPDAPVAV